MLIVLLKRLGKPATVTFKELGESWGTLIDVSQHGSSFTFTLTEEKLGAEKEKQEAKAFFDRARANKSLRNAFVGL
jgi:hypothetical protein